MEEKFRIIVDSLDKIKAIWPSGGELKLFVSEREHEEFYQFLRKVDNGEIIFEERPDVSQWTINMEHKPELDK